VGEGGVKTWKRMLCRRKKITRLDFESAEPFI
jgi:hypothetical protein